jgi:hypothetical protein
MIALPKATYTISANLDALIRGAKMRTILAVIMSAPILCHAVTGNELYADMQNPQKRHGGLEYVQGLMDMHDYLYMSGKQVANAKNEKFDANLYICTPQGATYGQAYDLVKNYLTNHPESRNGYASELAFMALAEVWRCKE